MNAKDFFTYLNNFLRRENYETIDSLDKEDIQLACESILDYFKNNSKFEKFFNWEHSNNNEKFQFRQIKSFCFILLDEGLDLKDNIFKNRIIYFNKDDICCDILTFSEIIER